MAMRTKKGKVCTQCSVWLPFSEFYKRQLRGKTVIYSWCKECTKARNNKYYQENRDEIRARERKRRAEDEEYKERHRSRDRARYKGTRRRNTIDRMAKWRDENRERYRVRQREAKHRRRAKTVGVIREWEWQAVLGFYGDCCLVCGSDEHLTMDHVVPISKGGPNYLVNVQPLCKSCNSKKWAYTQEYREVPVLGVIPYG